MAKIKCPSCDAEIDSSEATCPTCLEPVVRRSKKSTGWWYKIPLALIVLVGGSGYALWSYRPELLLRKCKEFGISLPPKLTTVFAARAAQLDELTQRAQLAQQAKAAQPQGEGGAPAGSIAAEMARQKKAAEASLDPERRRNVEELRKHLGALGPLAPGWLLDLAPNLVPPTVPLGVASQAVPASTQTVTASTQTVAASTETVAAETPQEEVSVEPAAPAAESQPAASEPE
ncbi:MAG: hypothetical protein NTY77_20850 [Elusimicrobia bacterium]|nr:hypothetical protein [Elusimicrobiota bacterium]